MERMMTVVLALVAAALLCGCASIKPYSLVEIVPDTLGVHVIMPASGNLQSYDSGLATQWDRTFNYCYQRKKAVSAEIDQRERRLTSVRTWLLGFGGVAGLASTVYSGIKQDPRKDVIIPLSVVSGTALITLLPSFSQDERLEALKQRLDHLRAREQVAVNYYNDVELTLSTIGLEQARLDPDQPSYLEDLAEEQEQAIRQHIVALHSQYEALSAKLRTALVEWANAAQ